MKLQVLIYQVENLSGVEELKTQRGQDENQRNESSGESLLIPFVSCAGAETYRFL